MMSYLGVLVMGQLKQTGGYEVNALMIGQDMLGGVRMKNVGETGGRLTKSSRESQGIGD